MQNKVVIKGHVDGPNNVVLDEPAPGAKGEVEVIVRTDNGNESGARDNVFAFLRGLHEGGRSKEDIDNQIREERDA
jgi:hypothetical protein